MEKLPSRGVLSNLQGSRIAYKEAAQYVCTHDTAPPVNQVITTDTSADSMLKLLKRDKAAAKPAQTDAKGKRPLNAADRLQQPAVKQARVADAAAGPGPPPAPPASASAGPQQRATSFTLDELNKKTVKDLQDLLRARSLQTAGRKDELVRRLLDYQRRQRLASQPS